MELEIIQCENGEYYAAGEFGSTESYTEREMAELAGKIRMIEFKMGITIILK